jgi:predicted phosphodiesterase
MAKASVKNNELAMALVLKHPDATSTSLGRRLYAENVERFPTQNAAYLAIRRAKGNQGNHHRKYTPNLGKPNGTVGWVPECPPSQAESWEPFVIESPARVLSLSDAHVPYHVPKAIEAAVEYARKKFKPDVVLLNGDWADFYQVSRWEKNPDRCDGMVAEMQVVEESLSWLRGRFPKARMIYKMGNHEERWDKYIWGKAPELWKLSACRIWDILKLHEKGIEWVSDQRPIMAGELPILHGHELGNFTNSVNHARGSFLRTLHAVLVGHGHRTSTHCEPNMFKSETTTWSQGALCDLSPEYARFNKWNWGFATVETDKAGAFNLMNYRMNNDFSVRTS